MQNGFWGTNYACNTCSGAVHGHKIESGIESLVKKFKVHKTSGISLARSSQRQCRVIQWLYVDYYCGQCSWGWLVHIQNVLRDRIPSTCWRICRRYHVANACNYRRLWDINYWTHTTNVTVLCSWTTLLRCIYSVMMPIDIRTYQVCLHWTTYAVIVSSNLPELAEITAMASATKRTHRSAGDGNDFRRELSSR